MSLYYAAKKIADGSPRNNGCQMVQYVSLLFTKTNLCFTNYDVKDREISSLRGQN